MTRSVSRRTVCATLAVGTVTAALALWPRGAAAHRAHVSLTRVLANPPAGTWEFVHSIHIHDAIRALAVWSPDEDPNPAAARARARIALEVERRIAWTMPDGRKLAPMMVGAELSGDDVLVYQESPAPAAAGEYTVECTLLHDVFADQRNMVQFGVIDPPVVARLDAKRRSASFRINP